MLAGATEVAVVRRSLLFAMGWTDAAVHVENDHLWRAAVVNTVVKRYRERNLRRTWFGGRPTGRVSRGAIHSWRTVFALRRMA